MVNRLASSDACQNFMLFTLPVFGDHDCDGLTNRLFGSVAKDPLRTPIPACDCAGEVLAYNHIVTGLDDGCQPAQSLFTFAKRSFGLLARGNVEDRGDPTVYLAERIFVGRVDNVQQTRSDILEMYLCFVFYAVPRQDGFDMRQDGVEARLPHDLDDFFPDHLFRTVACHFRVGFAYEKIPEIRTATSEQKWRIG